MKKIYIYALCFSFVALGTKVKAQSDDNRNELGIGIKAGINNSNVWDEQKEDFNADSKIGFVGGAFLSIPLGRIIGFQPEVLISQKGFQGFGHLLGTPYSFSRTTTYLAVPLLLQVKPSKFITVVGGPQFSYLLHQKDVYTFGTNSIEQEEEFRNENIRKNIMGFTLGADVNLTSAIVISGRVGWDFQNNNGDGTSTTPRYKNQWLQLTLGYKF
jgi:hypothetical protein